MRLVIERNINREKAWFIKFKLLNIHDEIPRPEVNVFGQLHFNRDRRKVRHNRASIRIDKVEPERVFALVGA